MIKYMAVAVAVAVAVSGGGALAVAVPVAGLTKRFFNHIQKDFSINVWGYHKFYRKVPQNRCYPQVGSISKIPIFPLNLFFS